MSTVRICSSARGEQAGPRARLVENYGQRLPDDVRTEWKCIFPVRPYDTGSTCPVAAGWPPLTHCLCHKIVEWNVSNTSRQHNTVPVVRTLTTLLVGTGT